MGEIGRVVGIENGELIVSHKRSKACAKCSVCVQGTGENEMIMRAVNECGANAGDFVEVELKDGTLIKAVGIVYGIPFAAMLAGFTLGYFFLNGEIAAFAAGIMLMVISYGIVRLFERNAKIEKSYQPVAVRKLEGGTYEI